MFQSVDEVNAGWCMHDEAAAHYLDMVDQTTYGHQELSKMLGDAGWPEAAPGGVASTSSPIPQHRAAA